MQRLPLVINFISISNVVVTFSVHAVYHNVDFPDVTRSSQRKGVTPLAVCFDH